VTPTGAKGAAPEGTMARVTMTNLRVTFAGSKRPAVDGVSLTIGAGECLALVGESGSGKSVTARSLIGLAGERSRVTADALEVDGVSVLGLGRRQLERLRGGTVGTISQDALVSLDPLRLVGREVDDALRLHTTLTVAQRRGRVLELLRDAGIPDPEVRAAQRSTELSGGLRQRALIAAALAANPGLLIADEPTTALDAQVRDGVLELIGRQRERGVGVLLISHDLNAVAAIADRVAVMTDGVIVEEGPTATVLRAPQHPYTRRLLAASPAGKARHEPLLGGRDNAFPDADPVLPRQRIVVREPDAAAADPSPGAAPATGTIAGTASPALEGRDLTVEFAGPGRSGTTRRALDQVSFTLERGRTLGLVGPSGSGKTTLARVALGLQLPTAGEMLLLGQPWSGVPERDRRSRRGTIGAIYQDPLGSFDPRYTVGALLHDALGGGRGARRTPATAERLATLLDSVGLTADLAARRPQTLSGGQRQRVAIARALAASPEVLVLDEPVSALDVTIQAQILDLLDRLQRELGLSYLFISHDTAVIEHMSDDILRFD
jgi:peptide/nickel transport system ATP-binding protein